MKPIADIITKNNQSLEITTGQIRCSGRVHKITIIHGGPIILHNHTKADINAERIVVALGGEPCRCLKFLNVWKDMRWSSYAMRLKKLPLWAHPIFKNLKTKGQNRFNQRIDGHEDPLDLPIEMRIRRRILRAVAASLVLCNYRRKKDEPYSTENNCFFNLFPATLKEDVNFNKEASPSSFLYIKARLPFWYNRIYMEGLAVVGGNFILDILSQDETGYTVLAGRQNEDLSIEAVPAHVKTNPMGLTLRTAKAVGFSGVYRDTFLLA